MIFVPARRNHLRLPDLNTRARVRHETTNVYSRMAITTYSLEGVLCQTSDHLRVQERILRRGQRQVLAELTASFHLHSDTKQVTPNSEATVHALSVDWRTRATNANDPASHY